MILVADASALIALASCNSLHLLDKLFGEVSPCHFIHGHRCGHSRSIYANRLPTSSSDFTKQLVAT